MISGRQRGRLDDARGEGMVKRIAGFNLHETTLTPSDHPEKLVVFAVHPRAIAVAMRYQMNGTSNCRINRVAGEFS